MAHSVEECIGRVDRVGGLNLLGVPAGGSELARVNVVMLLDSCGCLWMQHWWSVGESLRLNLKMKAKNF